MIQSETEVRQILGFPALKGADFLYDDIKQLLDGQNVNQEWELNQEFHFGGYGRFTEELLEFIRKFKQTWGIELDPIYTGKLFYGVFNLASRGFFPEQSKIVIVHSGGLQGNKGFREKYGKNVF
jgi:1-aminocyclopropane-1-carboxylate deaminase